jgi:hypothetical protein
MCSSTRGPARAPSLVTWPTSTMQVPLALAARVRWAAHSRTWATEPGAEVSWSEYTVWIESITATSGCCACKVARIFSSWISASTLTWELSSPRRRARKATWAPLSSPLTYSVCLPLRCRASSACSSSVDLPMPGSPPMSTTPPSTMPPPSTRSSSSCPVGVRCMSTASMSASTATSAVFASEANRFFVAAAVSATDSIRVFQAPQAGHLPSHLGLVPPHSVQV